MAKQRPGSLQTAFWNANGLAKKKVKLIGDVMLVNETHLRASLNPKVPSYRLYRNDRENARGGGTAIYVKADLGHHVLNTRELPHAEATLVVVQTTRGPIRLVSVYNSSNRSIVANDMSELMDMTDKMESLASDDKALWRMSRILKDKRASIMPPNHGERGMAYTDSTSQTTLMQMLTTSNALIVAYGGHLARETMDT